MRLDKYLSASTGLTRSQATKVIRQKRVTVNGLLAKQGAMQLPADAVVELDDQVVAPTGPRYIVLHKPAGYVCSSDDPEHPTVMQLLDEPLLEKLNPVGRLDLDTTGLLLITDDGQWLHRITSPKHHVAKTYRVWLADPIPASAVQAFADGVLLRGEKDLTLPAELNIVAEQEALLTIREGRYHQVKRMFAAIGNKVVRLHREKIGDFQLPDDLAEGEYRVLSLSETALVQR